MLQDLLKESQVWHRFHTRLTPDQWNWWNAFTGTAYTHYYSDVALSECIHCTACSLPSIPMIIQPKVALTLVLWHGVSQRIHVVCIAAI